MTYCYDVKGLHGKRGIIWIKSIKQSMVSIVIIVIFTFNSPKLYIWTFFSTNLILPGQIVFSLEISFVRLLFHTLVCIHASIASLALKMKVFLQDIKWNLAKKLSYYFFLAKTLQDFYICKKIFICSARLAR